MIDAPNEEIDKVNQKPGLDFYIENGFCVFTAAFLARRGWCCGNSCRHCPYKGDDRRRRLEDPTSRT